MIIIDALLLESFLPGGENSLIGGVMKTTGVPHA